MAENRHTLYRLTRLLVRAGLGVFFHRVDVRHVERIPKDGPVVFVANHPNSIMDALVLGSVVPRKVNYLAHARLFNPPVFAWLLRNSGVIPIYRRQDDPEKMEQNLSAFQACYQALESGETIGIFPEGTSDILRKVKQVRTGTARIVLETEARNGYDLGVKLVPIGLHFFSRSRFRSRVLANIGEPVPLVKYFTLYNRDQLSGVRQLTEEIQARLEKLTINVREQELDAFVHDLEDIYRDELKVQLSLARGATERSFQDFLITQRIAECVQYYQDRDPALVSGMRDQVTRYKRKLAALNLRDSSLREPRDHRELWRESARIAGFGLAGLPFALYGVVNNIIPYSIAEHFAKKFVDERTKILTALLLAGAAAFLLFYAIQVAIVAYLFGGGWATLYGISLPATGFWALSYLKRMRRYGERMSFTLYLFTNRHLVNRLRYERRRLIRTMDQIAAEYRTLQQATATATGR